LNGRFGSTAVERLSCRGRAAFGQVLAFCA
jgi:hypothetical protein